MLQPFYFITLDYYCNNVFVTYIFQNNIYFPQLYIVIMLTI